jgi:hypothetical protein
MFFVVKCPNCAFAQVTSAKKVFRCQKCLKTKSVSYLKKFYSCDDGREAALALQALQKKWRKQSEYLEFYSYGKE